jgi:hypothetical protein
MCGAGPLFARYARIGVVTRVVHVLYAVEQDEDGVWCASAQIRPGVGAVGDGPTPEAAVADLRAALVRLLGAVTGDYRWALRKLSIFSTAGSTYAGWS